MTSRGGSARKRLDDRNSPRTICFVTGTRAEWGLMRPVLEAISRHPRLRLQIVVTGMHLHRSRGRSIDSIAADRWPIDAVVSWPDLPRGTKTIVNSGSRLARATGNAIAELARCFERLAPDIVLVVGDRPEALAGALAAHLSRILVAHAHGGDRALGQSDDCLRHAITKLSHIHFPATAASARRLARLGEDSWRIFNCGTPGVDGIEKIAAPWSDLSQKFPRLKRRRFALLVLHPATADEQIEYTRAQLLYSSILEAGINQIVIVYPNSDPGAAGIMRRWIELTASLNLFLCPDLPRPLFLGLMCDAAVLVGNSSAGIIESGSFTTPVLDVGPRQTGRERGPGTVHIEYSRAALLRALRQIWRDGHPRRMPARNVYGASGAGRRIAAILGKTNFNDRWRQKLIAY